MVGVDREDSLGAVDANGFEDGQEAGLLFGRRELGGAGAGGFSADVENVCAAIEQVEAVLDGGVEAEELAAIGEAVGRDVEDAHDEGLLAELEGASAELPDVSRAGAEGHLRILEDRGATGQRSGRRGEGGDADARLRA